MKLGYMQNKREFIFCIAFVHFGIYLRVSAKICVPLKFYDSRVLRNETLLTPSGPEGSSGRNFFRVPQGSLAITPIKSRAHRA